jgi:hypothetical protein
MAAVERREDRRWLGDKMLQVCARPPRVASCLEIRDRVRRVPLGLTFAIGVIVGIGLTSIAGALLLDREYRPGGDDAVARLAKRRRIGGPPHPQTDPAGAVAITGDALSRRRAAHSGTRSSRSRGARWWGQAKGSAGISFRSSPPVLPFLPFVPEQSLRHYLAHAIFSLTQPPLLWMGVSSVRRATVSLAVCEGAERGQVPFAIEVRGRFAGLGGHLAGTRARAVASGPEPSS